MFNGVFLIHRPTQATSANAGGPASTPLEAPWTGFVFKTCLRQIIIADELTLESMRDRLSATDEVHSDGEAYGFLLQVICGLHSPLVGETEVYGQFKQAVSLFTPPPTPWGTQVSRLFKALFEDAKKIRQAHLEDLGSQSYGSVLRRELKKNRRIHILGAGHLVQEILPWLCKDSNEVHVHCRQPEKARSLGLGAAFPSLRFHALDEADSLKGAEAVVIAAPVGADWFAKWFDTAGGAKAGATIADLRGDSASDVVSGGFAAVLDLNEVFQRIDGNRALIEERKTSALAAIDAVVRERSLYVEYRPFGWEDVCA